MLELLMLSVVVIPNMNSHDFNVKAATARQMELFKKASEPYSYYQDAEIT